MKNGGRQKWARGGWLQFSIAVPIVCSLLHLFAVPGGQAWTWHVPDDLGTIKEAIEYYACAGDTVRVAPGVYDTSSGEIFPISFFLGGVVLMSDSGPLATIIDGGSTGRVFACDNLDSTTVIAGFTITGGDAPRGGGILCDSCFMRIQNNVIRGNSARSGGGIYCNYGAPRIIANHITENVSPDWCGGGVYCFHSTAVIEDNMVTRNTATFGGGIFNDNSNTTIARNVVEGNCSRESGGGLDCYMNSSPTITQNVVMGNVAGTNGAGIACCYDCSPTITYNTIVCNVGEYGGGVRSLGNSSPKVRSNIIVDNVDGVYLTSNSGAVTATGNHLYLNTHCETVENEVVNNTLHMLDLTDNFWLVTDSSSIDSLIYGPARYIPPRMTASEEVPGEPSAVASVTVMADKTYGSLLRESLQLGDTLYIQLIGDDWNSAFIEPAMVIISSHKDPHGIGVALVETGAATGVYRGVAGLGTISNDSRNQLGANPNDTIVIRAHVDPMICDTVTLQPTGVERGDADRENRESYFAQLQQNCPNPFSRGTSIWFTLPANMHVQITIFDSGGRLVRTLVDGQRLPGYQAVYWNGTDKHARTVGAGIYFCELSTDDLHLTKKMIRIR